MGITFVILTTLSVVSILILYIVEKLILKKEVSFKNIFITIIMSAILSFISSIILMVLFYKFQKLGESFLIPLISSTLFVLLAFVLYKTRSKLRNSFITISVTILLTMLYINFWNNINHKFLFNISRTTVPFKKINNKIQNTYIILLKNESNSKQEISLKVLNKDIKIIQPNNRIQIEPNQKIKVNVLLESNPKNIKSTPISIEASNGSTEEIRKSIFVYNTNK